MWYTGNTTSCDSFENDIQYQSYSLVLFLFSFSEMSPLGLNIVQSQCVICDKFNGKYGLSVGSQLKLLTGNLWERTCRVMKVDMHILFNCLTIIRSTCRKWKLRGFLVDASLIVYYLHSRFYLYGHSLQLKCCIDNVTRVPQLIEWIK